METNIAGTFGYASKIMNSKRRRVRGIIFVIESGAGGEYNLH